VAEVPILPAHVWAKIPIKTAKSSAFSNTAPLVGSGPFQCVQWKKSDFLVMQANKSYWRGAAHVDEVVFEEYTNADTMGEDMKSGAIDGCLGLLQAQMHELAHTKGVQTRPVYVNGYDELGFNCYTGGPSLGNPVLKDWRFRQALQWAVDKNKLCAIAYGGMAKPADTVITANYYRNPDWHWTPPADQAYSFNLAKASQMLTAAGYKEVNGVRLDHSGKPISLRLYARSSYPQGITCGEFLTGWFRRLGLRITLSTLDDGALESALYNTVKGVFTPNYDMFLWGWYNDVDPGPSLSYLTTAQIDNWSDCAWSDHQYDATYQMQSKEMDQAKRVQLVDKCQQIIYEQSPYIPLAYSDDTEAWNTARWTDWVQMPARVGNVVFPPYGFETYFSVRPKTSGGGGQAGLIGVLVIGAVLVVVAVAGVLYALVKRRTRTADEPLEE
jgi:peptide/nickel transport system substrate-binding protein